MWVSKVSEIIGSSPEGYEDAARRVVERAGRTLRGITGIEVVEKRLQLALLVTNTKTLKLLADSGAALLSVSHSAPPSVQELTTAMEIHASLTFETQLLNSAREATQDLVNAERLQEALASA